MRVRMENLMLSFLKYSNFYEKKRHLFEKVKAEIFWRWCENNREGRKNIITLKWQK